MLNIQKYIGSPKIVVDQIDERTSTFSVQYLPRGFGHTLGNGLRRAILGYSAWGSITALKIKGVAHEYHTIDWVKETVLDMMANFKKLRFTVDENVESLQWITQRFKGTGTYTSSDLKLPSGVTLINQDVPLFELSDASIELIIDVRLEKGFGYYSMDFLRGREEKADDADVNILLIDNDFKIVEFVTYELEEAIDDFSWGSKDKLMLTVKTIAPTVKPQDILSFAGEVVSSYARLFIFDDAYIDSSMLVDYYDIVDKQDAPVDTGPVKTIPIDALPLSERTRNALIKNEILYVEDLEKKRKSELLTMKWIWKKAVDEIIESLANMWKSLEG